MPINLSKTRSSEAGAHALGLVLLDLVGNLLQILRDLRRLLAHPHRARGGVSVLCSHMYGRFAHKSHELEHVRNFGYFYTCSMYLYLYVSIVYNL